MTTTIDLSRLPVPDVIEPLDYETILAEMKAAVIASYPAIGPVMATESEPAVKVLEVCASFVLMARARVNDGARAIMLAHAAGSDLDNLAALYGVARQVVTAANPLAVPPVEAVMESDASLRLRVQLAPEGFSVAGPRNAYVFHALSASGQVKDVLVTSPASGEVLVTILSSVGNGSASAPLLATVYEALNADDVRPLCDSVTVQSALPLNYAVTATLEFFPGPDPAVVLAAAQADIEAYVADSHRIGRAVRVSGIHAALHQSGVSRVILTAPTADVIPGAVQAPFCTAISVTAA
jgi:phage-related baseplate assembly protein